MLVGFNNEAYNKFLQFLADDGEVFQVKKSSHSKKIRKFFEKEKEKKKKTDDKSDVDAQKTSKKTKEMTFNNEITIKIKNNLVSMILFQYWTAQPM